MPVITIRQARYAHVVEGQNTQSKARKMGEKVYFITLAKMCRGLNAFDNKLCL